MQVREGAAAPPAPPVPASVMMGILVGSATLGILIGVVIFLGARKMQSLQSYGLAMTAAILAMLPCVSPCCLVGLPIGIWALVVLSDAEVKGAFR
jgi:hypothetical protein